MLRTFTICLTTFALIGVSTCFLLWGKSAGLFCAASVVVLAIGFAITKGLIDIFTGRQRNPVLIIFLFAGKLAWWASLFLAAKAIKPQDSKAVTMAMVVFLFSLVASGLAHNGISVLPKDPQST